MREVSRNHGFIMGASGAAIAFAMHHTNTWEPSTALATAFVATVFWAFSFFSGLMNSHAKQAAMAFNVAMNEEKAKGTLANANSINVYKGDFDKFNKRARYWYYGQLYALLIGALFFVLAQGFHVYKVGESRGSTTVKIEITKNL